MRKKPEKKAERQAVTAATPTSEAETPKATAAAAKELKFPWGSLATQYGLLLIGLAWKRLRPAMTAEQEEGWAIQQEQYDRARALNNRTEASVLIFLGAYIVMAAYDFDECGTELGLEAGAAGEQPPCACACGERFRPSEGPDSHMRAALANTAGDGTGAMDRAVCDASGLGIGVEL